MLKIRLQRLGRRNRAHFRIVLCDARVKRQGGYLEKLGHYDPVAKNENNITVDLERVKHWVGLGAQPSDSAVHLFKKLGLKLNALHEESRLKKKAKAVGA